MLRGKKAFSLVETHQQDISQHAELNVADDFHVILLDKIYRCIDRYR